MTSLTTQGSNQTISFLSFSSSSQPISFFPHYFPSTSYIRTTQPGFESSLESAFHDWFVFGIRHGLAYLNNDHSCKALKYDCSTFSPYFNLCHSPHLHSHESFRTLCGPPYVTILLCCLPSVTLDCIYIVFHKTWSDCQHATKNLCPLKHLSRWLSSWGKPDWADWILILMV